jgi:hypothetical protein
MGNLGCLTLCAIFVLGALILGRTVEGSVAAGSGSSSVANASNVKDDRLWNHKAFSNPKKAEKYVGGFTNADRRDYKQGLQHIENLHEAAGAFTIAQIIKNERQREQQRNELAEQIRARQEATKEAAREAAQQAEEANFFHGDPNCLVLDERTLTTGSDEYVSYVYGKVQNKCDKSFSYVQVQVSYMDSHGDLSDSGLANVNNLGSGETWSFKIADMDDAHKSYRLEKISGF